MNSKILVMFACLALIGTGCETLNPKPSTPNAIQPVQGLQDIAPIQPAKLPANFERRSISFKDGRNVDILIVNVPKENWTWSMQNNPDAQKKVNAWRQELKSNLVINGSYFTEENKPSGLYKTSSKNKRFKAPEIGDYNGYTGFIGITDGKLRLGYLPDMWLSAYAYEYDSEFLSFPTLLTRGASLVQTDSGKFSSRTVLAQDKNENIFIVLTEKGVISLFELAQWLENQPEQFQVAINLDGGPSSGISFSLNKESYDLSSAPVPNILSAVASK